MGAANVAGSVRKKGNEIDKLIIRFDNAKAAVEDAAEEVKKEAQDLYGKEFVTKTDPYGNPWRPSKNPNLMWVSGDLGSWAFSRNGLQITMQQPKQGIFQHLGAPQQSFWGGYTDNGPRLTLPWDGSGVWQEPIEAAIDTTITKWLKS